MTLKHELTPLQIDGSKAGSGKARQPTRENDSASTLATMSILYGLSEGVVRGFGATFTLDDVKKRLYMDGTPVMAADGTMLQEVEVDFRDGSVQQTPIEGMPAQTVETAIDLELRAVAPISRTFNRAEVDSFEVRISIPQLVTNTIDGDSLRRQVEFAIDIATDSGSFSEYGRYTIYEKITQGFQRTYPVQIPKAGTRTIRVRRLTPDNTSDLSVDKIIVEAMVEVVEVQFTYPHTALLWVRYDARNYSSVPKMELLMDGKADLRLPANYNPETREYATTGVGTTGGVWDGTWKIGYSDNPVWHWFDLATSARYGTGNRITIDIPDKFYLYSLARYCDELVPDGAGGYEPRFTCNNLYLQAANDAFQVFKDIASIFRAKTVWDGAHLNPKMDVPRDAMLVFSRANVSNVKYSSTSDSAQHNLIGVQYYDTANQYKSKYAYARDLDDIRQRGRIVDTNVSALGCTSEGQAQRMATYLLQSELKETRIISFTTGLDGMRPIIGDVFIFGDDLLAGKTTSGRVVSVAGNVVTLDRELTPSLDIGGTFIVNTTENFASTRKIVAIDPDNPRVVTLDTAITVVDITELVWAVRSVSVGLREYTIDDIEYDSDAKLFNISGVQYARDKYPASDGAARIENAPVTIIDPLLPSAPASVVASYFVKVDQGINIAVIDVAWTQVAKAAWYELEMRRDGSPWQSLGRVVQMTFSVDNAYLGIYEFRVRAIDAMSTASAFATSQPLDVRGKILPPPALEGILVTGKLFGVNMAWVFPPNTLDSRYTRLRVTFQNPAETTEPVVQVYDVAYPSNTFTIDGLSPNVNVWVQAALVDSYGNTGSYTNWSVAASIADATQVLDQLKDQLTSAQLDQALREKIEIGAISGEAAAEAKDMAQAATNKINTEVLPQLNNLGVGLTQEITNRQDGDAHNLSELNAYKLANDNAVAAAMQQATTAISTTESNAALIGAVQGQLTNLAGDVQQKADNSVVQQIDTRLVNLDGVVQANNSAVLLLQGRTTTLEGEMANTVKTEALQNYYTKQQANDATAGQITTFKANLHIGGRNLVRNTYPRAGWYWMFQELLTQKLVGEITVSFDCVNLDGAPNGGGVGFNMGNGGTGGFNYFWFPQLTTGRHVFTGVVDSGNFTHFGIYTNSNSRISNLKVEYGNVATGYTAAPEDMYVGGENLLLDAAFSNEPTKYKGFGVLKRHLVAGSNPVDAYNGEIAQADATEYVLSFDARATVDGARLSSYFYNPATTLSAETSQGFRGTSADGQADFTLSTTMQRYWVKWRHEPTSGNKSILVGRLWDAGVDVDFEIARPKLEIGGIPTDFNIAPATVMGGINANATALDVTNSNVLNLDNRLTAESTRVSQLSAAIDGIPAGGGNLLINGDFSLKSTAWWGLETHIANQVEFGVLAEGDLVDWQANAGTSRTLRVHAVGAFDPSALGYIEVYQVFPVVDSKLYQLSIYTGVHRGRTILFTYFYDANSNQLGNTAGVVDNAATNEDGAPDGRNGGHHLSGYKRLKQNVSPPAGTTHMRMCVRTYIANDTYLFATRAMCSEISNMNAPLVPWIEGSGGAAYQSNETKVQVQALNGQVSSLAQQTTSLSTTVGNNTASINSQLVSINGLEARATLQVVAGNTIGGVALGNNGGVVDAVWRADSFSIAPPISAGAGDVGKAAFNYRATPVTLPNGTVVAAGLYLNNLIVDYIDASRINADSLSAITANFGTFVTYKNPNNPNGARMVQQGALIRVYDDNNVMRVRLGLW